MVANRKADASALESPGWRKHLDKFGIGGSLFAALCCLGFPAILSTLSALGLGFLIRDAVLIPLLLLFLAVTLVGLYLGSRHHHYPWALALGALGAATTLIFIGLVPNGVGAGIGIVGLVVASVLNVWFRARQLRAR
jgi:mercuric ion transport protein